MNNYLNNPEINSKIKENIEREISAYGDYKYAYAIMNKSNPNEITIINNNQPWFYHYLSENYQFIDPVFIKALDRVDNFAWGEKIMASSSTRLPNIFHISGKYNITTGHGFVLHDNKNNIAILSFFENSNAIDFGLFIDKNKEALHYLLIRAHQKLLALYHVPEDIERRKGIFITERENAVLYWASLGKTYPEIAIILDISLSTVKFHIRNVVSKLNVSNARHAIKLATEMRLVRPPTS